MEAAAAEDVLDELLNLMEASSKNPMEEFLNDLLQAPYKEESLENLLEKSSRRNQMDEILNDLIDATNKDEVKQLLNDMTKSSSNNGTEKDGDNSIDISSEDTMNHQLIALMEASPSNTTNQQLMNDLLHVTTINDPIEEILNELSSKMSSFKNPSKEDLMMEESSQAPNIQESFTIDPDDLILGNLDLTFNYFQEEVYSMCAAVEKNVLYRRNDPGTTREEWCNWPDMPFEEMDNTLNVQQYIQQCIHKDPSDVDTILKAPPGQEEGVWKYEHVRQFCMQLNGLTLLLQDECKPDVCVQMTATEQWIFLCAAHKNPKECSAIDYTRHTLDGAAALLNSNKYFPSRVSIKESSIAKIGSVCRRIYRIFSHAYFHHPELFEKFETETHLCRRFTVFVKKYNLMANEHLIVPILDQKPNHP
uniref:MOB-like protein phocein n=1 Tax=Elaeophora elaphi TaxID=1147741 RepID=A0A0R3RLZ7_9BILA